MQFSSQQNSESEQIAGPAQLADCQPKSAQGIVLPTLEKRAEKGIGTMAQFSGQTGSLEKHRNNWTVVYRYRNPGETKWRKKRTAICPTSGPELFGLKSPSAFPRVSHSSNKPKHGYTRRKRETVIRSSRLPRTGIRVTSVIT